MKAFAADVLESIKQAKCMELEKDNFNEQLQKLAKVRNINSLKIQSELMN